MTVHWAPLRVRSFPPVDASRTSTCYHRQGQGGGMTIYHCDSCQIEWGWNSNLPPPRVLRAQGRACPACGQIGVSRAVPSKAKVRTYLSGTQHEWTATFTQYMKPLQLTRLGRHQITVRAFVPCGLPRVFGAKQARRNQAWLSRSSGAVSPHQLSLGRISMSQCILSQVAPGPPPKASCGARSMDH